MPAPAPDPLPAATLARWRLVLGRYASEHLPNPGMGHGQRIEAALDYLYGREYAGRGVREKSDGPGRHGSLDPSVLTIPNWLGEVRELFPKETVERIEKHALDRYGLTELVTDRETLSKLEPSFDLLRLLLTFRGHLKGPVLDEARRIIRHVVEDIRRRLANDIRRTLAGKLNRFRRSPLAVAQNFDWRGTIRDNLKHYDRERGQMVIARARFFSRQERRLPWTVVLCVDQSGSMASSVIYTAVMAGILAGLPSLRVRLVVFDTSIVDLSAHVDDPVETLLSVQLGGGTDIGRAMTYCEQTHTADNPRRTVLVLVSDFYEGASPQALLAACRRLREAGVRLLGLAALDEKADPAYDRQMADRLAAEGMDIAALTPKQLAEWLVKVIS